jgi:hypothetical protein
MARALVGFGLGGSSVSTFLSTLSSTSLHWYGVPYFDFYGVVDYLLMFSSAALCIVRLQVAFSLCMEFLPAKGRGFWLVFLEAFWTVSLLLCICCFVNHADDMHFTFRLEAGQWRFPCTHVTYVEALGFVAKVLISARELRSVRMILNSSVMDSGGINCGSYVGLANNTQY